jgi:hypothetical protein
MPTIAASPALTSVEGDAVDKRFRRRLDAQLDEIGGVLRVAGGRG